MKKSLIFLAFFLGACSHAPTTPPSAAPAEPELVVYKALAPEIREYSQKLVRLCPEQDPVSEEVLAKQLVGLGYYATQPEIYSYYFGKITFLMLGSDLSEEELMGQAYYLANKRYIETGLARRDMMAIVARNACLDYDRGEILFDLGILYGMHFMDVDLFNQGFMETCQQLQGEEYCQGQLQKHGPYLTPEAMQEEAQADFEANKNERKALLKPKSGI